jgi:two-component sensor histidine kinase
MPEFALKSPLENILVMQQMTARGKHLRYFLQDILMHPQQEMKLTLILNALLSSALAFSHRQVEVELTEEKGMAKLVVRNDGAGYPTEYRAEKTLGDRMRLVDTLVRDDLRGEITQEGEPQQGACVMVTFPLLSE